MVSHLFLTRPAAQTTKWWAVLFLLWWPFFCTAQPTGNQTGNAKKKQENPLNDLKEGALLVRLKNSTNKIEALRKIGENEAALKLQKEQEAKNVNLVKAFQKKYRFSKVYFFFSEYSQAVKDKDFGSVVFVNSDLQPDSSVKFSGTKFFTAEVSTLDQHEVKRTKSEIRRGVKYHDGSVSTFEVLVLKDDKLEQLKEPYLIYVRTWDSLFARRDAETLVAMFTNKIRQKHDPKAYYKSLKNKN